MWSYIKKVNFFSSKASWIGWFVVVHLTLSLTILIGMLMVNINPTLVVSAIAAPLWVGVALLAKYITDKILRNKGESE